MTRPIWETDAGTAYTFCRRRYIYAKTVTDGGLPDKAIAPVTDGFCAVSRTYIGFPRTDFAVQQLTGCNARPSAFGKPRADHARNFVEPVTGFHVASVHSIQVVLATGILSI
jgi:hypothetical protein